MKIIHILSTFLLFLDLSSSQNIDKIFKKINQDVTSLNSISSEVNWENSISPNDINLPRKSAEYQRKRINWENGTCFGLATLKNHQLLNSTQRRQTYLLCRGPKYTENEAIEATKLYQEIQTVYFESQVCLPNRKSTAKNDISNIESIILNFIANVETDSNLEDSVSFAAKLAVENKNNKNCLCLKEDKDFDNLIRCSKNEKVLRWLWIAWREKIAKGMRGPFDRLINLENHAAQRNGYTDIGAAWREELEISNLRSFSRQLYSSFRPLYELLHGVVRFYLRMQYGNVVPEFGPIPAHLLGNLWAQDWESLVDLIIPNSIDISKNMKKLNWTVSHMVKRAEDFYISLGLPAMTNTFWNNSVFSSVNTTRCHGSAADMFEHGDFRLLYCSEVSEKDFYVLHHEMGHIQYYMAYEHQPGLFRQGANTAVHESIGDAVILGVQTPQHLNRLGLINDSILFNDGNANNGQFNQDKHQIQDLNMLWGSDDVLMLKQALSKLPQIPFTLLSDEYRWKYFEGKLDNDNLNKEFWKMALELQGILPPNDRHEEYFDAAANFYVADNTPSIRYFLSSFIQYQLFECLCKAAVFGRPHVEEPLPDSIIMNRCDIYGSKAAGKMLTKIMSRGSSQNWQEILKETTAGNLTSEALARYYQPLQSKLIRLVRSKRIPIGW